MNDGSQEVFGQEEVDPEVGQEVFRQEVDQEVVGEEVSGEAEVDEEVHREAEEITPLLIAT